MDIIELRAKAWEELVAWISKTPSKDCTGLAIIQKVIALNQAVIDGLEDDN